MIDVKLSTCAPGWPWARQFPGNTPTWGPFRFHIDSDIKDCDAWVVFESLAATEQVNCPPDRTIFVTGEPDELGHYDSQFLAQFHTVLTGRKDVVHPRIFRMQQAHPWFVERSMDELLAMPPMEKAEEICVISSDKAFSEGHRARLRFVQALSDALGPRLHVYGRGIRDFDSKWDLLSRYRYAIVLENQEGDDFLTEKLPDAWLAWCYPFYAGCTNVGRYHGDDAWTPISMNEPERAVQAIVDCLDNPQHYSEHLAALSRVRLHYLWNTQFFPNLAIVLQHVLGTTPQSSRAPTIISPMSELTNKATEEAARQAMETALTESGPELGRQTENANGTNVKRLIVRAMRSAGYRLQYAADRVDPPPPPPPPPPPAPPPLPASIKEAAYRKWVAADGDRTLRVEYPLSNESIIFDVGGFEGQWASDMYARYRCRIHVFEPVPSYATQIAARFAHNDAIRLHSVGLGRAPTVSQIAIDGDASSTRLESDESVEIQIVTPEQIFDAEGVSNVDLMKVNIEGAEYDLLDHLIDTGMISRIRRLQVHFHDFVPDAEARMQSIQKRLSTTHRVTYQFPFIWENWVSKELAE